MYFTQAIYRLTIMFIMFRHMPVPRDTLDYYCLLRVGGETAKLGPKTDLRNL